MDKKIISGIAAGIAIIALVLVIVPNIDVDTNETETNYTTLSSIEREKIGLVMNTPIKPKIMADHLSLIHI